MIRCKTCKNIIPKKEHHHNVKFCSVHCRNKSYQLRVSQWTRDKYDRLHDKPSINKIICLICNRWYRQVGTHIVQRHQITAREYREYFDLEVKKGLLPEDLRIIKAKYVFENGTVNNLKSGKVFWFIKGDKRAGKYHRSFITLERLKDLHKLRKY